MLFLAMMHNTSSAASSSAASSSTIPAPCFGAGFTGLDLWASDEGKGLCAGHGGALCDDTRGPRLNPYAYAESNRYVGPEEDLY